MDLRCLFMHSSAKGLGCFVFLLGAALGCGLALSHWAIAALIAVVVSHGTAVTWRCKGCFQLINKTKNFHDGSLLHGRVKVFFRYLA